MANKKIKVGQRVKRKDPNARAVGTVMHVDSDGVCSVSFGLASGNGLALVRSSDLVAK